MHQTATRPATGVLRGLALLNDPVRNEGTAFTLDERKRSGLEALLPPSTGSLDRQVERVLGHLDAKPALWR